MAVAKPPLADRTLWRVMQRNAEERGDRPAVTDGSMTLTHGELWDRARRCAGGLRAAGVTEGDVVLIMLDNSVDYFTVFAAVSFVGAVSVPTNTAYKGTILRHVLTNSRITHAVVERDYAGLVADAAGTGALSSLIVRDAAGLGEASPDADQAWIPLDDVLRGPALDPLPVGPWHPLVVMYTSGTTGPSKGALTSHAAAYTVAHPIEIQGPHDESDVLLVVCPMFHTTGLLGGVYGALIVGARAHVVRVFSASRFWDDVDKAGATSTILVGAMCNFLMQQPPRANDREHTLRKLFTVPRPASMIAFSERFDVVTTTAFGCTEIGSALCNLGTDPAHLGSVGKPREGVRVLLVDEHDLPVPVGEPGEALIRTDEPWCLATEYVNDPAASAALWRNGWLHTGDLLRRDEEGWYYYIDRVKDCLRRRGENISSIEVETEVMSHPEVLECAALGVGDDLTDQEVLVIVRRSDGASVTAEQLIRYLVDRLPYYAVPRFVGFVDDFPRTPTGKVRKAELRRLQIDTWDREAAGIRVGRARPRRD